MGWWYVPGRPEAQDSLSGTVICHRHVEKFSVFYVLVSPEFVGSSGQALCLATLDLGT